MQLSDHDFAQQNSCSDPNPGNLVTTVVLCLSCLKEREKVSYDTRLLSIMSGWGQTGEGGFKSKCNINLVH